MDLTSLATLGKPCQLMGMGTEFTGQKGAGQVFGRVWDQTELILQCEPALLAGFPDPLLLLIVSVLEIVLDRVLDSILKAYMGAYSQASWESAVKCNWEVLESMPRSILKNILGGVLGSKLEV
jgi:hypothetical protein